jgi:hypothetical protein
MSRSARIGILAGQGIAGVDDDLRLILPVARMEVGWRVIAAVHRHHDPVERASATPVVGELGVSGLGAPSTERLVPGNHGSRRLLTCRDAFSSPSRPAGTADGCPQALLVSAFATHLAGHGVPAGRIVVSSVRLCEHGRRADQCSAGTIAGSNRGCGCCDARGGGTNRLGTDDRSTCHNLYAGHIGRDSR